MFSKMEREEAWFLGLRDWFETESRAPSEVEEEVDLEMVGKLSKLFGSGVS